MPDQKVFPAGDGLTSLEDDELCRNCGDAPATERARCAECLAWFRRNGHDRLTPRQDPKLSADEASRAATLLGERAIVEWLMTPDRGEELPPSLEVFLTRPEWHRWAACRGVGTEAFIARRGPQPTGKEFCEDCVVRQECLDTALADPELAGIWGGTSSRERREMRRARRSAA